MGIKMIEFSTYHNQFLLKADFADYKSLMNYKKN